MLHVTVHISEGLSWRVEARAHNERDDGSWELLAEQTYWPTLPPERWRPRLPTCGRSADAAMGRSATLRSSERMRAYLG